MNSSETDAKFLNYPFRRNIEDYNFQGGGVDYEHEKEFKVFLKYLRAIRYNNTHEKKQISNKHKRIAEKNNWENRGNKFKDSNNQQDFLDHYEG